MHAGDLTDPTSSPDAPIPRFDSGRGTLTEDPPQVAPHAGAIAPVKPRSAHLDSRVRPTSPPRCAAGFRSDSPQRNDKPFR